MEFKGKTAIITGASRGIGAAAARHLSSLGMNVVLVARSAGAIGNISHEINESGGNAVAVSGDVADFATASNAVELAVDRFGSVDVLVNNAGVIDPIARLADSDPDEWANVVDINLKGVYFGLRAAIPVMERQGGGTIINISSGAATSALEGWSHYCATKAAVLSLTRCADKEYRDRGIRVVGLSPGTVATEMQVSIKSSGINPVSQLDPSVHIPADWVAKAIAYLCTDDAAEFAGTDFSLKTDDGRARVGLPAI
ncbi:MAG: SDR family oxidoreductase [Alphaproteobacteria bacterium]